MPQNEVLPLKSRNPANELYDRACDMLEAAQGLRRALRAPGHQPALNATFGCLTDVLIELTAAIEEVGRVSGGRFEFERATEVRR